MKAVCIDDEPLALEYLERQLEKISGIEVIGTYADPQEGKKSILAKQVDVAFLDIQLPEINGIELAEQIIEENPEVIIVFVTAYDEFAVNAFELNALDYLVKPIKFERLQRTIKRIEQHLSLYEDIQQQPDNLQIKVGNYLMFEVEKDVFKPISWRTSKTQELFLYLLQNRGKYVEKTTLIELLWEDFKLEKGYSLLYTTVYNVRKALSPFSTHFTLHNKSDGYLLELNHVSIDLMDWEDRLHHLPLLDSSSIQHYEEMMQMNQEHYLYTYDYIWAEAERHRLERLWLQQAHNIAEFYITQYDLKSAAAWYEKICKRSPEDEDAHFSLMKLYAKWGKETLMIQQYEQLTKVLENHLAIEPRADIKKWFKNQLERKNQPL